MSEKYGRLKEQLEEIERLEKEISELKNFLELSKDDEKLAQEVEAKTEALLKEIEEKEKKFFLSGKYDRLSAILEIKAGAGGRDAEDWVAILLRMYQRFCKRKGFSYKIIDQTFTEGGGPEGRVGIRNVSLEIKGKYAFGILKNETGVHRLVRISPFSPKKLRHTSFAKVEVLPKFEQRDFKVELKESELKIETFKASGPGGQYVNKRETAVRITHLPTGIQVCCQSERSLAQNKKLALEILMSKLFLMKEKEKEKEINKFRKKELSPEFGRQIRSYIFHPYKLVKDHRTKVESSNLEEILDGKIDEFVEAEIRLKD